MGHIQRLCKHAGIVRIPGAYLERFTWVATLWFITGEEVEIMGAMRMPKLSELKDLRKTLIAYGIKKAVITRSHYDGTPPTVFTIEAKQNAHGEWV